MPCGLAAGGDERGQEKGNRARTSHARGTSGQEGRQPAGSRIEFSSVCWRRRATNSSKRRRQTAAPSTKRSLIGSRSRWSATKSKSCPIVSRRKATASRRSRENWPASSSASGHATSSARVAAVAARRSPDHAALRPSAVLVSSRPASISASLIRAISASDILTSGGRTTARGSLPSSTSASFMRLCMSTKGSA